MKRLLFLVLLLNCVSLYSQSNQFLIGVDWLNSTASDRIHTTLSPAYWDTAVSFGINFANLNLHENVVGVSAINTQLTNAYNHGIAIELETYKRFDWGQGKRWAYQIEGTYDFNFNTSSRVGVLATENGADKHWSVATLNVANYWRLQTSSFGAGIAADGLKNQDEMPNSATYYVKIRIRKPVNVTTHTAVAKVTITENGNTHEGTIYADGLDYNVWQEKSLFSFTKTGSINIQVYWYGTVNCDLDYVSVEDYLSNILYNGTYDSAISSEISNYATNPGLAFCKVWEEPTDANYLDVRYLNRKAQEAFDNSGHPEKIPLTFNNQIVTTEKFIAQTGMKVDRSDIYSIYYALATPGASGYTSAFQNRIDDDLIYRANGLREQIIACNKFNIPFWFTPQAHSWETDLREPSAYETKAMVNLSVCYGAKGIMYFMYSIPYTSTSSSHKMGVTLLDDDSPTAPIPRYYDAYGNPKWETLKKLNQKLASMGSELMSLTWQNGYSISHSPSLSGSDISGITSATTGGATDGASSTYVELGTFKKTNDLTDPNLDYFFIVNRRTLSTETRNITVTFNKSSTYTTWLVTEVGGSNYWIVSNTGNFTATYQPGEGKLFRFEPLSLSSSLTIPSGSVLTIQPGVTLSFSSSASLIMNGKLIAQGTSSQRITFTAQSGTSPDSWGSIVLNGSGASGSVIKYANIRYGHEVQFINVSNFEISNCNLYNDYIPIYVSASSGTIASNYINSGSIGHVIELENTSSINCRKNTIVKSNHRGHGILYGGGSNGYVWQNDIRGTDWGVGAIWGSSPQFYNTSYPGDSDSRNTRITNCNYAVMVYNNSYPVDGEPYPGNGLSSIHDNTVDISLNYSYSTVSNLDAVGVYWNSGNPSNAIFRIGSGSQIYTSPYLTTDPWAAYPLPTSVQPSSPPSIAVQMNMQPSTGQSSSTVSGNESASTDPLSSGINLRHQKKNRDAKNYFVSYLSEHPDNQRAYVELYNCADDETCPEIIAYFKKLPTKAAKEQKLLLSYLYLKNKNVAMAKQTNDNIINENPNTTLSARAMINNAYIALYNENNVDEAVKIFNEAVKQPKLSTEMELADLQNAIISYADVLGNRVSNLSTLQSSSTKETSDEAAIPAEYELSDNYPNPFNPTTMIHYGLPENGFVTLKVYDVLGREVATLVNEYKTAGSYNTVFNGSNLASGVYIYRLTAGSHNMVKKMILMK